MLIRIDENKYLMDGQYKLDKIKTGLNEEQSSKDNTQVNCSHSSSCFLCKWIKTFKKAYLNHSSKLTLQT